MKPTFRFAATLAKVPSTPIDIQRGLSVVTDLLSAKWICDSCLRRQRPLYTGPVSATTSSLFAARYAFRQKRISTALTGAKARRLSTSNSKYGSDNARDRLPSHKERQRSHLSKRLSNVMDHMQSNIFIAGQRLNDLTGYSGIEALKKDIEDQELAVKATRLALQEARTAYSQAISSRSSSQREVNELLQRKNNWSPADLERFTALYRSDHANEQAEASAREDLTQVEKASEEAAAKLSASILARYHEEQIWSDKIRRMSTWGTWGLMGVNILLFLVFQIGVEPWRRKRLVKGFEEKVVEALDRESTLSHAPPLGGGKEISQGAETVELEKQENALEEEGSLEEVAQQDPGAADAGVETKTIVIEAPETLTLQKSNSTTSGIKETLRDMFSERQITISRVDLTTAMLEGAAAGIAFVGVIVLILRPR